MKRPELLSPVGNFDCLYAAISAGCDAVYLGGKEFGARNFANNFTNEEIVEVINLCHLYKIKVYVTVNTMIYENEFERVVDYIEFLHKNNVDAVIVQDIGLMDYLRQTYPNLEIHASTQMHIHNLEGAKFISELGLKRVVLARETPIELIKNIKENTNIELEIFIHGALCLSYSGQCLMSSLIGGRSGNRGTCSQCCRMKYNLEHNGKVINDEKYLLSTKDLNTLEHINELIDIGVDSLKIEGRMKSPEYVYLVTKLYRHAIDSYIDTGIISYSKEDLEKLKTIFNRKYTKGFIFHEENNNFINQYRPNHLGINLGKVIKTDKDKVLIKLTNKLNKQDGIRFINKDNDYGMIVTNIKKNNIFVDEALEGDIIELKVSNHVDKSALVVKTSSIKLANEIKTIINKSQRKVIINGKIICNKNKPIILEITDYNNHKIEVKSEYCIEESKNIPITKERIYNQLNKLGSSIYKFNNIEIIMDDNIFINIKELNELRRKSLDLLNKLRTYKVNFIKKEYKSIQPNIESIKGYSYFIHSNKDLLKINNNYIDLITDNIELYKDIKDKYNCFYKLPRVIEKLENKNIPLSIGELGSIYKYNNIISDFSLNVANSYSVAFLHNKGVKRVCLSLELTNKQIKDIIDSYNKRYHKNPNVEVIVDSYPEVMISKFNLLKYYNITNDNNYLIDRFNNKFKIDINNNLMIIYHYKKIIKENHNYLFNIGVNVLRIEINE